MPFGRLHEEAAGDSKIHGLSNAAFRMWAMGLIYCQKNLTDGFIPAGAIHFWHVRAGSLSKVADELCTSTVPGKAPLWSKTTDGYQIHDYLQWNDSKVDILKMRAEAKIRIARFRQRHRSEQGALQPSEQPPLQNALHNGVQNAHDVVRVRGTWEDPAKKDDLPRTGARDRPAGVFAGALPREHLKHAACDDTLSRCVPQAVHDKLVNKLAPKHGGDRDGAQAALQGWYPVVWASLPANFVIGEEFKFWQARFDEAFASKGGEVAKPTVPDADATKARLAALRRVE